ncbi:MAG: hypothetical protein P8Y24_12760, partial [Gammaproteobacteria bacterium]
MKKSNTAIILSAFVFPGAGHVYIKKIKTGLTLIGISLIAFGYIISDVIERAFAVVEQIQLGNVAPDVGTITALIEQQTGGSMVSMASYAIGICWLFGIVDCYRLSKLK